MKPLTLTQLRKVMKLVEAATTKKFEGTAPSLRTPGFETNLFRPLHKLMDAEAYMVNYGGGWSNNSAPQDPRVVLTEIGYKW